MKSSELLLLFVATISFSTATAQQKSGGSTLLQSTTLPSKNVETVPKTDELMPLTPAEKATIKITDDMSNRYYEIVKQQTQSQNDGLGVKDRSAKLITYFNTNGDIQARLDKIYDTKFSKPIIFKALPNEPAKFHLLAGIPEPITDLPTALATYSDRIYQDHLKKIDNAEEDAKRSAQELAGESKVMQTYKEGSDEAVRKMYEEYIKANLKNNPITGQMDVGALQKMSPKEREEYARKMTAAQTGGMTPEQIKKMTPEQKRALAEQMARKQMEQHAETAVTQAEKEADAQKIAQIVEVHQFENKIALVMKKTEADLEPIRKRILAYQREYKVKSDAIANWMERSIAASPLVRDSELGLRIVYEPQIRHTAKTMFYELEKERAVKEAEIWYAKIKVTGEALREFENIAAAYAKTSNDEIKLRVASIRAGGFDDIRQLLKEADGISNSAASAQYSFNCEVLHNFDDPRADKRMN